MQKSHYVNHAIFTFEQYPAWHHYAAMKLTDITSRWIAERRDALGLKDVAIYTAAGIPQDTFSKSMNGKRQFKPAELQSILEFLTGESAASNLPTVAEIRAQLPLLDQADLEHVLALVERLRAKQPPGH